MGSSVKMTLPVTPVVGLPTVGSGPWEIVGTGSYHQPGVQFGPLSPMITSSTSPHVEVFAINAGNTFAGYSSMSSSNPVAWATNGGFSINITYRIA